MKLTFSSFFLISLTIRQQHLMSSLLVGQDCIDRINQEISSLCSMYFPGEYSPSLRWKTLKAIIQRHCVPFWVKINKEKRPLKSRLNRGKWIEGYPSKYSFSLHNVSVTRKFNFLNWMEQRRKGKKKSTTMCYS